MKKHFLYLILLIGNAWAAESPITVIRHVTLISPDRPDKIEIRDVAIKDGKILAIQKKYKGRYETSLSGKGKFLTPGLIDSHVHLAIVPGMSFKQMAEHSEISKAYEKQLPKSFLYYGYTTLVDLNVVDRDYLNRFKNTPVHPDLYDCDGALVMANGYPMNFEPSPERFESNRNFLYDIRQKGKIPSKYTFEKHTPKADVERIHQAGGICIKSHYEPGFSKDMRLPVMTSEMASEIHDLAKQYNMPFMLHANSYISQKFGVEHGVDIFAHGLWNWGPIPVSEKLPVEITDVLDRVVQNRIGYQATTQVIGGLQALFDPQFLDNPMLLSVLPASLVDWYKTDEAKWFRKTISEGQTAEEMRPIYINSLRRYGLVIKYLADHNAKFLFGTDTPSAPTYGNPPGYNGFLEMNRLKEYGLSLEQIFKAATISNAEAFHLENEIGTVDMGKKANLLLLNKNPLKTIEAYDSIEGVFVAGQYYPRENFDAKTTESTKAK